ncbi:MAG: hypothetical protein ACREQY_00390 [Candidatus Binatia bacterium]
MMLFRVSCKACRLSSIWTDDPGSLLQSVCLRYRHCEARLEEEGFSQRVGPRSSVKPRPGSHARPKAVGEKPVASYRPAPA